MRRYAKASALYRPPAKTHGVDWAAIMAYRVKPGHEMTLEEVAAVGGVSRERIRQIEFEALRKLRHRPSVRAVARRELEA